MSRHVRASRQIRNARIVPQLHVEKVWRGEASPHGMDFIKMLFTAKIDKSLGLVGFNADDVELDRLAQLYADWIFMLFGTSNRVAATEEALRSELVSPPTGSDLIALRLAADHLNQKALVRGLNLALFRMVEEQHEGDAPDGVKHKPFRLKTTFRRGERPGPRQRRPA